MRQLIEVHNQNDLRHLCIIYDDDYPIEDLISVYDNIMLEDDKITGKNNYENSFLEVDNNLYKILQLKAIRLCIQCLELGRKDLAKQIIDNFKLKVVLDKTLSQKKALELLNQKYKSLITQIEIKKKKELEKRKDFTNWADMQVHIHTSIKIMPDYDCTVAQYRAYEKVVNKLTSSRNGEKDRR